MKLAWLIGLRYAGVRSTSGGRFMGFISLVSLFGMTLGVIALIVVVSVMNGFDAELKRRVLGAVPHMVVTHGTTMADEEGVVAAAPFLDRQGMLVVGRRSHLVAIHGVDPRVEAIMSNIPEHMRYGDVSSLAGERGLILGAPLAYRLGLAEGEMLTLVIPQVVDPGTSVVRPVISQWQLVGTFELDAEPDYGLALVDGSQLATVLGTQRSQRLVLGNLFDAPRLSQLLRARGLQVRDWTGEYGDFFRTVRMEKNMMFTLLFMIVIIAAFNIVSSLSMMVREKEADVAVLRTMGLPPSGVLMVFLVQGSVIGFGGIALGLLLGLPLAALMPEIVASVETMTGLRLLAGTYFSELPVDIRSHDIMAIVAAALAISLLASAYPAWRASQLAPASVLRYE